MIHASWIRALDRIEKLSDNAEVKRIAAFVARELDFLLAEQIRRI